MSPVASKSQLETSVPKTGARLVCICLEDEVSGWLFLPPNPLRSVRPANRLPFDPPKTNTRRVLDPSTNLSSDLQVTQRDRQPVVFSFERNPREREVYLRVSSLLPSLRSSTICFVLTGSLLMVQRVFTEQTEACCCSLPFDI